MTTPNPYAPPAAEVHEARPEHDGAEDLLIPGGRSVPAGHGLSWFGGAWRLFKTQWLMWWLVLLLVFGALAFASFVQFLGVLMGLVFPVMAAGIGSCARTVLSDGRFEIGQLFDGFRRRTAQLFLVGAIYTGLSLLVVAVLAVAFDAYAVLYATLGMGDAVSNGNAMGHLGASFFVIYFMALLLVWSTSAFAPYLVLEHNLAALPAMQMSVSGCLKNIVPGVVSILATLVLAILATIPVLLGWLVFLPVLMLMAYVAYRDIYVESPLQA